MIHGPSNVKFKSYFTENVLSINHKYRWENAAEEINIGLCRLVTTHSVYRYVHIYVCFMYRYICTVHTVRAMKWLHTNIGVGIAQSV